jgi:hypothetical protein
VTGSEFIAVLFELRAQSLRRVGPVMQVDFDFAIAGGDQLANPFHRVGIVFILRAEERMARRPAIRIPNAAEQPGIAIHPAGDSVRRLLFRRVPCPRLKVIHHAEDQMPRLIRAFPQAPEPKGAPQIRHKPFVGGLEH